MKSRSDRAQIATRQQRVAPGGRPTKPEHQITAINPDTGRPFEPGDPRDNPPDPRERRFDPEKFSGRQAAGADLDNAAILLALRPQDRAEALRALAGLGLSDYRPEVLAAAFLLHQACATGQPEEALRFLSITIRGGQTAAIARRDEERNFLLRMLRKGLPELSTRAAAARIAEGYRRYKETRWQADRRAGRRPEAEPDASFYTIAAAGASVPGAARLARILAMEAA